MSQNTTETKLTITIEYTEVDKPALAEAIKAALASITNGTFEVSMERQDGVESNNIKAVLGALK